MDNRSTGIVVVIDLDYPSMSDSVSKVLWKAIERRMAQAGFALDGRSFVTYEPNASQRALQAMKSLAPVFAACGMTQFEAVRNFYCYELASRLDLAMIEATSALDITELPC